MTGSTSDLALVPLGAMYFGDGRPTSAGETDHMGGRFPPTPFTLQGLLRTRLLQSVPDLDLGARASRQRIEELVGSPDSLPPSWFVEGPYLAQWTESTDGSGPVRGLEPWLATPLYVLGPIEEVSSLRFVRASRLGDTPRDGTWPRRPRTDQPLAEGWLIPNGSATRPLGGYISPSALRRVLRGDISIRGDEHGALPPFVREEPKAGIRMDSARSAVVEGMLYSAVFRRFAPHSGFHCRFSAPPTPPLDPRKAFDGVGHFGGRRKLVRLAGVEGVHAEWKAIRDGQHLEGPFADGARIWIILTTPLRIEGPIPSLFVAGTGGVVTPRVLGWVVGRAEPIGGFDLARHRSRAVAHYLPAGSAFLVALEGGDEAARRAAARHWHMRAALGNLGERTFGFGHTMVARVPVERE